MAKVSFKNNGQLFYSSLKKSVEDYFQQNNIKKTGNWKLYLKTIILIPMAVFLYVFLLTGSYSALGGTLLCILLGLNMVSIAFNVMHDACHGSYSSKGWVNHILGFTMNALGSNSYIWKIKHNVVHHTYTNVDGIDDDIAKSPVLRHCPTQKWLPMHRYQHIYMFLAYAISTLLWVFLTDMIKYFSRKIVVTDMKLTVQDHIIFWASKTLYVVFYIVVPIALLGWLPWLVGYLVVNMTMGLTLAIVFQLAHVVEKTHFEEAGDTPRQIESEWAIHQFRTTANFAPNNRIVNWFVGGLNYQVEHHLFPKVSHVHYPSISKIVKEHCEKYGVPYHSYPKMRQAIISHIKVMKQLGKPGMPEYMKHSQLSGV